MKKMIVFLAIGLLLPFSAVADDKRRGGLHLSYSEGGDVADSSLGLGGQVEYLVSNSLGLQFAVNRFSEEDFRDGVGSVILDISSVGLSAITAQ